MGLERTPWVTAVLLVGLMLGMSLSLFVPPASEVHLREMDEAQNAGLNQNVTLAIMTENGSSSALKAEIPVGHTVESIDISLSPDALAYSDGFTWSGESDWNASGAVVDRVNVNVSEGMQLLPQEWIWDFETSNHGWSLHSGTWSRGSDTTSGSHGLNGGVHGGSNAIYTYQGDYPNRLSGTRWATSPAVDCSGCSGTWNLQYWKRIGVESSSWDHAYVQVKNTQGSWITLWSNGGTVNDGSYRLVTHNIANYVQNNPAFQVRFGLGSTDSSVTYTGWNVDDVSISPAGGGGGGEEGNWTSARFGPGITGAYGTDGDRYGITSIDATIPTGAALTLSILDGVSKTPIPGYSMLDPTWVDLGGIDAEKHPSLRLKLHFDARSGPSPVVHSIGMNHRYDTSFRANPVDAGWTLNSMDWGSGSLSGAGVALSPLFTSHRAIAQAALSTTATGSWQAEVSLDGGPWQVAGNTVLVDFPEFGHTFQFKLTCLSGSCTFSDVNLELYGGHLPTDPAFDIGMDGWNEWEMIHPHISTWAWQDRFTNGRLSTDMTWSSAGLKQVGVLLPKDGLEHFSVDLAPFAATESVEFSISVAGQPVHTKVVGFGTDVETVTLSPSDLSNLNENLSNAPTFWGTVGGVAYVIATLDIDGTYGSIRVGGMSAIHRPAVNLSFPVESTFVMSMNQALLDAPIEFQNRLVPLTLRSSSQGGAIAMITNLISAENVILDSASLSNFSAWAPVTPSWQWMELELGYSWDAGVPSHLALSIETSLLRAQYHFPTDGSPYALTLIEGTAVSPPLLFQNEAGGAIFNHSVNGLNVTLPFQTNASLADSSKFKVSAALYMTGGSPSPDHTERSGQNGQGIENDIEVLSWEVLNELGVVIPPSMSYLRSDSPIEIEAKLGFENIANSTKNPRSGDVRVHLLENGIPKMSTTELFHGVAIFAFTTPFGTGNVTYSLEIEPLMGQSFVPTIPLNRTFTVDSLSPQVVGQNIQRYDHLAPSPNQLVRIEVYDRPVLPTELSLMVWRQWLEDANSDGVIDVDEFTPLMLQAPGDLTVARGNYSLLIDDTVASEGDMVAAYVVGADPAGNSITDAGTSAHGNQLFTYQVLADGPPTLPAEGGFEGAPDGQLSYLHPGVDYSFGLHIVEPNGWSDIGDLRLQLASNSVTDTLAIEWSASDGRCVVFSAHMDVQRCGVRSWTGELTPFNPDLEFFVEFRLNWTLPREGDMRWEPSIEVTDRSGQGAWLSLPQLRWRYSPDLAIDTEEMRLIIGSGTYSDEGAWVAPTSTISLEGAIHFPVTGTRPSESFDVRILLDGQESIVQTGEGQWAVQLTAPEDAGSYPLTVELAGLPGGANDVTDTEGGLRWIVVDQNGPEAIEVISPRAGSELPNDALESLRIDIRLAELEQIDADSLILHWKVIRGTDVRATPLVQGEISLAIEGGNLAGQSIIAGATLDLASEIPSEYFSDELRLHIWIEGSDMAGNAMQTPQGTNRDENPFASWSIERRAPVFLLDDADVTYSRSDNVEVGENVMITIALRNDGEVAGTARLHLTEVHLDGTTRDLTAVPFEVDVPAGGRTLHHIDWEPDREGRQWIRVTVEDSSTVNGPTLRVVEAADEGLVGAIFGGVNLVWTLLFIGLLLLLAGVLMIALRSGGSHGYALDGTEDDDIWDEVDAGADFTGDHTPDGFPLDYRDETVRHVMGKHGISDTIGFIQYARGFDTDGNGFLKESELQQAAASFVAADGLTAAAVGDTPALDPATMSPEQLAWYEQAKQWGGYHDESGTWIPL
jgi:hypothetical protein